MTFVRHVTACKSLTQPLPHLGLPSAPRCENYVEAYEIADIQLFLTYKNGAFLWFGLYVCCPLYLADEQTDFYSLRVLSKFLGKQQNGVFYLIPVSLISDSRHWLFIPRVGFFF